MTSRERPREDVDRGGKRLCTERNHYKENVLDDPFAMQVQLQDIAIKGVLVGRQTLPERVVLQPTEWRKDKEGWIPIRFKVVDLCSVIASPGLDVRAMVTIATNVCFPDMEGAGNALTKWADSVGTPFNTNRCADNLLVYQTQKTPTEDDQDAARLFQSRKAEALNYFTQIVFRPNMSPPYIATPVSWTETVGFPVLSRWANRLPNDGASDARNGCEYCNDRLEANCIEYDTLVTALRLAILNHLRDPDNLQYKQDVSFGVWDRCIEFRLQNVIVPHTLIRPQSNGRPTKPNLLLWVTVHSTVLAWIFRFLAANADRGRNLLTFEVCTMCNCFRLHGQGIYLTAPCKTQRR